MEPHIQLLSKPDMDFKTFLSISQKVLGYHILQPTDKLSREVTDFEKFITSLACFHSKDCTIRPIREIILNSASLCAHLHFSFMFGCDYSLIFKSMERTQLTHTTAENIQGTQLCVVSGTLTNWKAAILECCDPSTDKYLRILYGKVMIELEKLGVFWLDTCKSTHSDGTLLLESK